MTVVENVIECHPNYVRSVFRRREVFSLVVCLTGFLLGLTYITQVSLPVIDNISISKLLRAYFVDLCISFLLLINLLSTSILKRDFSYLFGLINITQEIPPLINGLIYMTYRQSTTCKRCMTIANTHIRKEKYKLCVCCLFHIRIFH